MKLINLIFFILFFLYTSFVNSKDINFSGLKKLSVQDLSALVSIDLYKKDYSLDEINTIITDLFNSEIINDVNLNILEDKYLILIEEAMLINNIYINGNIQIKDDDLKNNLFSKPNNFINKFIYLLVTIMYQLLALMKNILTIKLTLFLISMKVIHIKFQKLILLAINTFLKDI